ncbi:unnamed protein product [marine sediment metagenome]|uniref:Uncharacterized protein n=1 Tax=marine sediment metagenome TaxID=412755 RepID=X1U109_9ZZZZ
MRGSFHRKLTPSAIITLDNGRQEEILSFSWVPIEEEKDLLRGLLHVFLEKSIEGEKRRIILIYKDKIVPLFGDLLIEWGLHAIKNIEIETFEDSF